MLWLVVDLKPSAPHTLPLAQAQSSAGDRDLHAFPIEVRVIVCSEALGRFRLPRGVQPWCGTYRHKLKISLLENNRLMMFYEMSIYFIRLKQEK